MDLKSLLLSSDDRTVRILRRVLSDLEIGVEHCADSEEAVRRLTRQRFEAIIVDCSDTEESTNVLRASKAAPVNKRALSIVLVENDVGLKGGFEMGAHFVLHKPLAVERAKASFRAVRALMKSERRLQMRVPVQVPVVCLGSSKYHARTLDLCEGGMAIRFVGGSVAKENNLRFTLELPGMAEKLEIWGELAWEGDDDRAGVRFKGINEEQRNALRDWLNTQLPEREPDDPPVVCRLKDLSGGGCYLTTTTPFPKSTRVILSVQDVRAGGVVRLAHPEYGMGVEFVQATPEQQAQVGRIIETLGSSGESPEVHVEPDGLEGASTDQASVSHPPARAGDSLVDLFRQQSQVSVEVFLKQMQQQRHLQQSS
jgi:c-di-GMP-binding flagellar brake protein YcgR